MKKHQYLYQDLQKRIKNGEFPPGTQLPTEKELCRDYSVSRITAMRAVKDLAQSGIVERKAGKGTFVSDISSQKAAVFYLIVPDLKRSYYSEMANEFNTFFYQHEALAMTTVATNYNLAATELFLRNINSETTGGIAIIPSGTPEQASQLLQLLKDVTPPVIIGSRELVGFKGQQLIVDEEKAGIRAVEHLTALGHSRIVYVGPTTGYSSSILRYCGYTKACQRNYLPTIDAVEHNDILAYRELGNLFKNSSSTPTAVIAADEGRALLVQEVLSSLNLSCPADVALICLDGGYLSPSMEVPLTSLEFPGSHLGSDLAAELWSRYQHPATAAEQTLKTYDPALVVRSSCGAQPGRFRHDYLRQHISLTR